MRTENQHEDDDESDFNSHLDSRDKKENSDQDFLEFTNSIGTQFRNFDSFTLIWAKGKAETMRKNGKDIDDITKLFSFHDEVWGKYKAMVELVPQGKRGELLKLFLDILYGEKHGKTHEQKLKKVEAIGIVIKKLPKKTLARFQIAMINIGPVTQKTYDIVYDETPKQFKKVSENLGTDFFKGSKNISTRNLQNLKIEDDPTKFFGRFKTIKDLKNFFTTIKTAATADAKDLIESTDFSKSEKSKFMVDLGKLDEKNPIAILKFISDLEKNRNNQVTNTNKEKKKTEEQKGKDSDESSDDGIIDLEGQQETKSLGKKEETGEDDKKIDVADESIEFRENIEKGEKAIDHAKRMKQKHIELGLPNTEEWWKEPDKRIALLKEAKQWDHCKKLDLSDKNMPSKSKKADGEIFRPRWVNHSTGLSNFASAENTRKYLDRLEDSGDELSTMLGFLSINWKDDSSPLYTPDEFISKLEHDITNLKAKKISKKTKIKKAA